MKTLYSVKVEINIGDEVIGTYIDVKANNRHDAYLEAVKAVNNTLDIRIEKRPVEALIQDGEV